MSQVQKVQITTTGEYQTQSGGKITIPAGTEGYIRGGSMMLYAIEIPSFGVTIMASISQITHTAMPTTQKTLLLAWTKQGTIQWENWYTQQHGQHLQSIPGLKDHVSFANYDLQQNNCPALVMENERLEIRNVPPQKLHIIQQIIEYHGFKILFVN